MRGKVKLKVTKNRNRNGEKTASQNYDTVEGWNNNFYI